MASERPHPVEMSTLNGPIYKVGTLLPRMLLRGWESREFLNEGNVSIMEYEEEEADIVCQHRPSSADDQTDDIVNSFFLSGG